MTRTAAVVGGGIGGLATAIGLHHAGWDVTVFERASALPDAGTGLGIWPSALRALDRLGIGTRVREAGRRQPSGAIRKPDGTRIATLDVGVIERKHGEPVYLVPRPTLLHVLAGELPDGVVRFATPVGDPAELHARHDVVVGADGIHSAVRRALFGDRHPLRYSGATAWRGTVPLDIEAGGETWGPGAKFGLTPQGPGSTNWYAMVTAPQGHRSGDDLDELRARFGDWHDPIPTVLELARDAGFLHHDLWYSSPLPSYADGNVALLGDAAHAMTPDLGQGACQAMIDAASLAEALTAEADIATALRRYDAERRKPTQQLAARSARISRLTKIRRFTGVRDTLVRGLLSFGLPA
ncbi:FAD-dependent monooxygenase [Prauserella oleivorans]|uniref:FAD-dependent monooxygenase n=1 Tax=Prauserella oleivorans TaxID=1478153 RepID=A0ABW5WG65_9PSEU